MEIQSSLKRLNQLENFRVAGTHRSMTIGKSYYIKNVFLRQVFGEKAALLVLSEIKDDDLSNDCDDDDSLPKLSLNRASIVQQYEKFRSNLRNFFSVELTNPFGETDEFKCLKTLQESHIDRVPVMIKTDEKMFQDDSGRKTKYPIFLFTQKKLSMSYLMTASQQQKKKKMDNEEDDEADIVVDGGAADVKN